MNYLVIGIAFIVIVPLLIMAVLGTAMIELDEEQHWHETL